MPYKVEIAKTESNKKFLENLPKGILPDLKKCLEHLGNHPYLGRSVEAPIKAFIYSFEITYEGRKNTFVVSYKMDESNETISIMSLGLQNIMRLQ